MQEADAKIGGQIRQMPRVLLDALIRICADIARVRQPERPMGASH